MLLANVLSSRAATALVGVSLVLTAAFMAPAQSGYTVGGSTTAPPLVMEPGSPRGWEGGIRVTPFSRVNARTGAVFTTIPAFGWKPFGPAIGLAFFHSSKPSYEVSPDDGGSFDSSSGTAVWSPDSSNPLRFSPNWRTSYSGTVSGSATDSVVLVIEDDGTRNAFHPSASGTSLFMPAEGNHDRLWWVSADNQWHLRRPDQTERVFDSSGKLLREQDLLGRAVTINRTSDTDWYIQSAAHDSTPVSGGGVLRQNQLHLTFDSQKRLTSVIEEVGVSLYPSGPRSISIVRDTSSKVVSEFRPSYDQGDGGRSVQFAYDTATYNLTTITDRHLVQWDIAYTSAGRFSSVTESSVATPHDPYISTCEFGITTHGMLSFTLIGGSHQTALEATTLSDRDWTKFTDRRGKIWWMAFTENGNLVESDDPYTHPTSFEYDTHHNVLTTTNALGNSWTATYGAIGNVLTASTPITSQTTQYSYEPVLRAEDGTLFSNTTTNFYRLTSATDPLSRTTSLTYGITGQPQNVSAITQPGSIVTSLGYGENSANPGEFGQLTGVTDPNGVHTTYTYSEHGFVNSTTEGDHTGSTRTGIVPMPPGQGGTPSGNGDWKNYYNSSIPSPGMTPGYNDDGTIAEGKCGGSVAEAISTVTTLTHPVRLGPVPSPALSSIRRTFAGGDMNWDQSTGRLTDVNRRNVPFDSGTEPQTTSFEYDGHNRTNHIRRDSVEASGSDMTEDSHLVFDPDGRLLTSTTACYVGSTSNPLIPNHDATATYDDAGRPLLVTSGNYAAQYGYDQASRLTSTSYGNGAVETRQYDAADRLTDITVTGSITHGGGNLILHVQYVWNLDNTVNSRSEFNGVSNMTSTTVFGYDDLGRLTSEARTGDGAYSYSYTYDAGGNRTLKVNNLTGDYTVYFYDVYNNAYFADGNPPDPANRLVSYMEFEGNATPPAVITPPSEPRSDGDCLTTVPIGLKRTVWYTYWDSGQVSNITVKDTGDDWYRDLGLYYQTNDLLYMALWDRWKRSGSSCAISDYTPLRALEVRFGSDPRERYMTRELSVNSGDRFLKPKRWTYTEPLGIKAEAALGDPAFVEAQWCSSLSPGVPQDDIALAMDVGSNTFELGTLRQAYQTERHIGTVGDVDPASGDPEDPENYIPEYTRYNHGDLVGSVMQQTADSVEDSVVAAGASSASYTAFGEPAYEGALDNFESRYRYCGLNGYESAVLSTSPDEDEIASYFGPMGGNLRVPGAPGTAPIDLVHVGYRWYQPSIGRFIQRDPLGIRGGLNVYLYCDGNPVSLVDPSGRLSDSGWDKYFEYRDRLPPDKRDEFDKPGVVAAVVVGGLIVAAAAAPLVAGGGTAAGAAGAGAGAAEVAEVVCVDGMVMRNGFAFSEYYYARLWETGRLAPSLIAKMILEGAGQGTPSLTKPGFFEYVYDGWNLVYNPLTNEVWHMSP